MSAMSHSEDRNFRLGFLKGNITQIVVEGGKSANRNRWEGNFWDD